MRMDFVIISEIIFLICHPPGVYVRPSLQNCEVEDWSTKPKLHELLLTCWAEDKSDRPDMEHIVDVFDTFNIQK